jgi:glycosyltransferase involved in cell wall biosynthesis
MAVLTSLVTARLRLTPALVSVQGVPDEDYPATARLLRLTGVPVVACGPGVADGLAENRLQVLATVPNGIAPPPPPVPDIAGLRREWGLPDDGPLLVGVGRLVPQKDHATAIRAVARLATGALVILGEGPLRHELENLVATLGIRDRVAMPGARPDARAVMAAADVVVLPSLWEGLPLAGLEALSARTPLVTTAARGIRETLRHEVDCLLVRPGDEVALATSIERVLADGALADRLVSAGAALAAGYTEERMVDGYFRLYREAVPRPA